MRSHLERAPIRPVAGDYQHQRTAGLEGAETGEGFEQVGEALLLYEAAQREDQSRFPRNAELLANVLRLSVGRRVRDKIADVKNAVSWKPQSSQMIADASGLSDPGIGMPVGAGPIKSPEPGNVNRLAVPGNPRQPAGPAQVRDVAG